IPYTINARDHDVNEQLAALTNGEMATVVIDATGNIHAINNGFHFIAHGGTYVLIGLQKQEIHFSHPEFHKREATLMSSRNATRSDFEYVMEMIRNNMIDPLSYITHRVNFGSAADQFPGWLKQDTGVIKAMIIMQD
ncbi:MAG TPA: zinc-binding dehydrogenase, partial [Flavitalea sp.]|nr:zinc-binding dehydrogenase [Flavitalea sp.]